MQFLVLATCLGLLSSSSAFPVSSVGSILEAALQVEADLGPSTPAHELPRPQGRHALKSKWINARVQTPGGTSASSKVLRRRSEMSLEEEIEMIRTLSRELQLQEGGKALDPAMADCVARKMYLELASRQARLDKALYEQWLVECREDIESGGSAAPDPNPNPDLDPRGPQGAAENPDPDPYGPRRRKDPDETQPGTDNFESSLNVDPRAIDFGAIDPRRIDLGAIRSRASRKLRQVGKSGVDALTGSSRRSRRELQNVERPRGGGVGPLDRGRRGPLGPSKPLFLLGPL